jgi:selenocysteine lyase/cysteine desulfurase
VASALDSRGARRVVVASEAEFPTVGHVWLAQAPRGAEVRWVPVRDGVVRLGDYDALLDGSTAIVSAAHGYYQNGAVQDVAEIARKAHAAGALIYVDAYQTMGTRPIDVRALDVDFLAAGNLKYLMGIPGIAFLYVRPELRDRLRPTVTGWFGRVDPFAFDAKRLDWADAARRFDSGTPPIAAAYVARAGMELVAEAGLERIAAWTSVLSERLIAGGAARGLEVHGLAAMRAAAQGGAPDKAPSTAFVCRGDSHRVEAAMRARGVLASARGPVVRMAPHFYSSVADVDRALDVLAEELAREAPRR